jgi:hypothetical protein
MAQAVDRRIVHGDHGNRAVSRVIGLCHVFSN